MPINLPPIAIPLYSARLLAGISHQARYLIEPTERSPCAGASSSARRHTPPACWRVLTGDTRPPARERLQPHLPASGDYKDTTTAGRGPRAQRLCPATRSWGVGPAAPRASPSRSQWDAWKRKFVPCPTAQQGSAWVPLGDASIGWMLAPAAAPQDSVPGPRVMPPRGQGAVSTAGEAADTTRQDGACGAAHGEGEGGNVGVGARRAEWWKRTTSSTPDAWTTHPACSSSLSPSTSFINSSLALPFTPPHLRAPDAYHTIRPGSAGDF
ncbi:hypothetical protein HYPSUDRAFT_215871 [Hypholoma sublateritium FD-334 SS-4]|uniref:Uncharacterized protein n=1 Tax=Hypholoma sublateritium (strain FD-334 SS-4) TaxID=945553 RepID=A0A0D2PQZ0_HYPSF|nr:hypothetical protein HYPSUDRAFT_215871 [Hypholoma sublateritium FD-334 SS-4]